MSLQALFMDGHSHSFHNANPTTTYSPTVIGGSLTNTGDIGNGGITMTSENNASGGSFSFSIPGMDGGSGGSPSSGGGSGGSGGMPDVPDIPPLKLQNLDLQVRGPKLYRNNPRLAVLLI